MRFLRMYLNKGQLDGKRLLSEKGVETLLSNQIGDIKVGVLKTVVPALTADTEFFPGRKKGHSMAFQRIEEDVPGMRSAGSQFWAGVLNTHCWVDPKKNIAAVLMTQSLPFVEPRFMGVYDRFERAMYAL
jgi:methyl acetate hydrolase